MRWALLLVVAVSGCAFHEDSSPVSYHYRNGKVCTPIHELTPTVTKLVEEGAVKGMAEVLGHDLLPDLRTRLVGALLEIVKALPTSTFLGLEPLLADTSSLNQALAPVTRIVDGVVKSGETGYQALAVAGPLLIDCEGKPLLGALADALREPAVVAAIDALLSPESSTGLNTLLEKLGLDFTKIESKDGFVALLTIIVHGISEPGFDVDALLGEKGLLGALLDPKTPPMPALTTIGNALLAPGPRLDATQKVTRCLEIVDAEKRLYGLVFDLLHSGAITLGGAPDPKAPKLPALWGGTKGTIDALVLPLLDLLATDNDVRGSLVAVVATLVRPSMAKKMMPDLVTVLARGVLAEVLEVLVVVAKGTCS